MASNNKKRNKSQVKNFLLFYKGLDDNLNQFAKFILIFESKFKYSLKVSQFSHKFPKSLEYFNNTIKSYVVHATQEDILVNRQLSGKKKATLFFTRSGCQFHGFLTHLRNSFCHDLVALEDNDLLISDKSRDKKYNCKGSLKYSIVVGLLKEIIAEYEKQ